MGLSEFWNICGAAAAVYGVICGVRAWFDLLFPVKRLTVAVRIRSKEDADALEMLLHEAKSASFRKGRSRVAVLWQEDAIGENGIPEDVRALIEANGAELFTVNE